MKCLIQKIFYYLCICTFSIPSELKVTGVSCSQSQQSRGEAGSHAGCLASSLQVFTWRQTTIQTYHVNINIMKIKN